MDIHGNTSGGIALVEELLIVDAIELAGTPGDGSLDVVLGYRVVLRLLDRGCQRCVGGGIAATAASSGLDGPYQLCKTLAAGGILAALAVFDVRPLRMTRHQA